MSHVPKGSRGSLPRSMAASLEGAGLRVVTDPDVLLGVGTDWTGRWSGPVLGLVRPSSAEQVAEVLLAARRAAVPVQVQGGNTGLVGGSVPDRPSLVLSTSALLRRDPVDRVERTMVVGAGTTLAAASAHARAAGLRVGVDLAARDSATIGGMVATNAGGIAVCAHGMMREQVRGLTAVLADGRVVRSTGRPRKDNAGYDLPGLLVGSEGTLGVVTDVELVLHPPVGPTTVGLLAVDHLAGAVAAARRVQDDGWPLLAAEVVDAPGTARAARALGLPDPLAGSGGWLVLLEVADGANGEGLAPVASQVITAAMTAADRARLWSYREVQTEVYATWAGSRLDKVDVSVRLDRLDDLVDRVRAAVAAEVGFFGHALDGNLHVQVVRAAAGPQDRAGRLDPGQAGRVLEVVAELGGAISAEHGIGRQKAAHLALARGADEIAWMRQLKSLVDVQGLVNPGVLLA